MEQTHLWIKGEGRFLIELRGVRVPTSAEFKREFAALMPWVFLETSAWATVCVPSHPHLEEAVDEVTANV